MEDGRGIPSDRLEDVAYLTRSENRLAVLEALRREVLPSSELRERTGASRPTLNRILRDFEERGWAERTREGGYEATVQGDQIAIEVTRLVDAMETIKTLADIGAVLPTEELWISIRHFRDATVRQPEGFDPAALGRYIAGLLEEATSFYWLTYVGPPASLDDAVKEGVMSGRLTAEGVITESLVEYYGEDPQTERFGEWYQTEELQPNTEAGIRLYRYDGSLPCNLFVVDDVVLIENSQVSTVDPGTIIESRNHAVRTWARDLIDGYIEDAEQVDAYWE